MTTVHTPGTLCAFIEVDNTHRLLWHHRPGGGEWFKDTACKIIARYALCLVICEENDHAYVLTERGQVGWANRAHIVHVNGLKS